MGYRKCEKCGKPMIHGTIHWFCRYCDVVISRREMVKHSDIRGNENE